MTISKATDRSSNISNEDLEAVLASLRSSTTESKVVSVEFPLLKPDWLLSRRLFCVRKAVTWLNTTRLQQQQQDMGTVILDISKTVATEMEI